MQLKEQHLVFGLIKVNAVVQAHVYSYKIKFMINLLKVSKNILKLLKLEIHLKMYSLVLWSVKPNLSVLTILSILENVMQNLLNVVKLQTQAVTLLNHTFS